MTQRGKILLGVPSIAIMLLLSPGVPAPVINPGGGDGGGGSCQDNDPDCWHATFGGSGYITDMVMRDPGFDDIEIATPSGLKWSSDGKSFHPFPLLPTGQVNSMATRRMPSPPCVGGECRRELWVGTSAGVFRQVTSPRDLQDPIFTSPFTQVLSGVSVSYVSSPFRPGILGPVYANVTAPAASKGLWRSGDGVSGWTRVLPDVEVRSLVVPYYCNTAADPSAESRVYVGTRCPSCTGSNVGAIWMSSNNGLPGTWTAMPGPSKDIKDLVLACHAAVSYRWMFAANGETLGPSVFRSLPTSTTLGANFEPWSSGLPDGGVNSLHGKQAHEITDALIAATNSGLYRMGYNYTNSWVRYPTRNIPSLIVNRFTFSMAGLEIGTSAGVAYYFGP